MIVDGHLDIAVNVLVDGQDCTLPAAKVRSVAVTVDYHVRAHAQTSPSSSIGSASASAPTWMAASGSRNPRPSPTRVADLGLSGDVVPTEARDGLLGGNWITPCAGRCRTTEAATGRPARLMSSAACRGEQRDAGKLEAGRRLVRRDRFPYSCPNRLCGIVGQHREQLRERTGSTRG